LKQLSGKNLIKILKKYGWKLVRVKGSHHILMKKGQVKTLSIPVHGNKPLKIGILKFFLKESGLSESDL
jgi:predicted RNA binding protein YcfA (HicA-like mRNA interferase family)